MSITPGPVQYETVLIVFMAQKLFPNLSILQNIINPGAMPHMRKTCKSLEAIRYYKSVDKICVNISKEGKKFSSSFRCRVVITCTYN